jgi:hypothetical protein
VKPFKLEFGGMKPFKLEVGGMKQEAKILKFYNTQIKLHTSRFTLHA